MKRRENFELFIISRFLVMLIFVVMLEFFVFFAMGFVHQLGMNRFPITHFLITLFLFVVPIVGAAVWFAKIISEEVVRIKQQEEELRQQYERARNLMLSDIAHDLRTPITTIAGYSKALNDGLVNSEEKRKEYLDAIENKAERMSDLITLLFEYVRLDSNNFTLKKEPVNITELLRENVALLYADVEEKGMSFEIDIPEEIFEVELDKLQFSRVITNLINNALKHNEAGTEIIVKLENALDEIHISVSDNGKMIPPMIADHIFEPFVMADVSRESKGGSGLGLSIAKKIVQMHGWTLELNQYYEEYKKSFVIKIKQ